MKKLRKTNKQQALARRNNSNIISIEARINRKNEKFQDKATKAQYKGEKKQRKVRKRQRAKASDSNAVLKPGLSRLIKVVACLLILVVLGRAGYKIYDLKQQEKEALATYESLLLQEKELEKQISIKDTPEYMEQQARNVLHMIKPGEILYIPDPDAKAKNRANASEAALNAKPPAENTEQDEDLPADQTDVAEEQKNE